MSSRDRLSALIYETEQAARAKYDDEPGPWMLWGLDTPPREVWVYRAVVAAVMASEDWQAREAAAQALVTLLGNLSCCYECDGPDRDGRDLRHNDGCRVGAALARLASARGAT